MKKFLLFAAAALVVATAGAQLKTAVPQNKAAMAKEKLTKLTNHAPAKQLDLSQFSSMKEMKPGISTVLAPNTPKKAGYIEPFYRRPAGMYHSPFIVADGGKGFYSYGNYQFLMMKPFKDYTWEGTGTGVDENCIYAWDFWTSGGEYDALDYSQTLTFQEGFAVDDSPALYIYDGPFDDPNVQDYMYQMTNYEMEEQLSGAVTVKAAVPVQLLSIPYSEMYEEGVEFMYSSKTMIEGGRYADHAGSISRYYGADPWGNNEYGWWFGKNASHVDGMGMMFEKPQHPYLLKNIYLQAYTDMEVTAPVKMTCKVYKMDEIPAYDELGGVVLPSLEPGELVVTGEAIVTPTTGEDKNGLITFTLYGQEEDDPDLTYEYTPTIDYPIFVAIDGYNDGEGMDDLVNFSAFVSLDDQVDEGYGELCYLKQGIFEYEINEEGDTAKDEDGNYIRNFTGEYQWRGLNNYFSNGTLTMKTGLTIFLGTENPFVTFNWNIEDGMYTFPNEGGSFEKIFEFEDTTVVFNNIEFFSWTPSEDGDWMMTWNGSEDLPEWLDITLTDEMTVDEEFTGLVLADVTAEPLPEGVPYREATIRFEIPGDYIEYTFMQGVPPEPKPYPKGDVNGDGEVNIADINCLIDIILGGEDIYEGRADVNEDGEVNIADVNAVIDIILS